MHTMSLHKKTHRMLLLLGYVYLIACPASYEVTKTHFDYNALGCKIERIEQRSRKKKSCRGLPSFVTELSARDFFKAIAASSTVYPGYEHPHSNRLALLSCVKFLL
jgi:hypothetical protein